MFWRVLEMIAAGAINVASGFFGKVGSPVAELTRALQRYLGSGRVTPGAALGLMRQAAEANIAAQRSSLFPNRLGPTPPRLPVPSMPFAPDASTAPPIGGPDTTVYQYKWVIVVPTRIGDVRVPVFWQTTRRWSRRQILEYLRLYLRELAGEDESGVRTARFQPTGRNKYVPVYEVIVDPDQPE